jgi:hypothetical protein
MPQVYGKPSSQADWLKLPAAKRGFKSYDRYKRWWNSTVAPRFTVSDDPFDPVPFGAQKAMVNQQVSSAINPIIKAFEDSISRRQKEGGRAINQATDTFVKGVDPLAGQLGAVHDTSIESQQGTNALLTQFVKDTGGYAASELGKMIPDADEGPAVSAAQKFGTGLSGQQLAQGSSTLSRMYGDRAADVSYGEKMPGYARAFGTEGLQDFQRQLNLQRQEGLGDIRGQIPGLVSGAMDALRSSEFNKAVARKGFEMDEQKANAPAAPDFGWAAGPATKEWLVDPATGEYIKNPNYKPKPAGGSSGDLQKRIDKTTSEATKLAQGLITPDIAKGKTRPELNAKAYAQILAFVRNRHPNLNENQVLTIARRSLAAGGYLKALGPGFDQWYQGRPVDKPLNGVSTLSAPSTAAPAKGPTVQRPTTKPGSGQLNPDRADAATATATATNAQTAATKKRETTVSSAVERVIDSQSATKKVTRAQAKKNAIKMIQGNMRGYPYKRIIAMADAIVDRVYGGTLYGK